MTQHYPHRIRLRGPWDCRVIRRADGGPLPAPGRLALPARLAFAGTFRFRRSFHWPAGHDPVERYWLTFAGVTGAAAVALNDSPLGHHEGDGPFEFDVTGMLQPRNQLTVELRTDAPEGGLWGEIALEVRRSAFLRDVEVKRSDGNLVVAGKVMGHAERPLELYVLLDDSTVHYQSIMPGAAFEHIIAGRGRQVRVELIDGGVVWYQAIIESTTFK